MTTERAGAGSLTGYVAEFIASTRFASIPESVVALARSPSWTDSAWRWPAPSPRAAASCGATSRVSACGAGRRASSARAARAASVRAFANGVGVHADDYDDTQLAVAKDRVYGLLTHPTAPALPSVLAVAEATGRSGKDLLAAYHVGVEVECKIAEAINPRHYQHGFHSTATCGALGAAAGVANLVGLSVDQTRTCLGIAGSLAAGVRENFGTMMKPFHAGRAAESGVIAAEFAQLGLTATPIVLEAGRGFFRRPAAGTTKPPSRASSASRGPLPILASPSSRTPPGRSRIPA